MRTVVGPRGSSGSTAPATCATPGRSSCSVPPPSSVPPSRRRAAEAAAVGSLRRYGGEVPRVARRSRPQPGVLLRLDHPARMDHWTRGRVALVGDAGYCPGPAVGGSTSLAVVGAYILAGELAEASGDVAVAFPAYEAALHDYVIRSRRFAAKMARRLVPGTRAGVWALAHGTSALARLPTSLGRRLIGLGGGLGLHESVRVRDYPRWGPAQGEFVTISSRARPDAAECSAPARCGWRRRAVGGAHRARFCRVEPADRRRAQHRSRDVRSASGGLLAAPLRSMSIPYRAVAPPSLEDCCHECGLCAEPLRPRAERRLQGLLEAVRRLLSASTAAAWWRSAGSARALPVREVPLARSSCSSNGPRPRRSRSSRTTRTMWISIPFGKGERRSISGGPTTSSRTWARAQRPGRLTTTAHEGLVPSVPVARASVLIRGPSSSRAGASTPTPAVVP